MKKIAFALAVSAISTCVLGASPVEKEFFKSASAPEFSNQQKQNLLILTQKMVYLLI